MQYKLGSLFDGSGGFPLAGTLCGVEPVWAAEVEPYPIAVTRSRFPKMRHLGDISKVNGADIEPVDIITFGSPCQDLSVAGKRAGLKHEANGDEETTRSGLFMEAVRIIKEMRRATNGKYPRFALWENVPGAFSSNKGEDFRIVCEELIKIVEPSAFMPSVPKGGWAYADNYIGDGWSLAYRVFDAQYWGVPQRRRRIHLVADFSGQCAREVLFEREGVRGYFAEGRTPWQAAPADAQGCPATDDREGEGFDGYNGDVTGGVSSTLGVNCGVSTGRNGDIERGGLGGGLASAERDGARGGRRLDAVGLDLYNQAETGDVAMSIRCRGDNEHTPAVAVPYTLKIRGGVEVDSAGKAAGKGALIQENKSATTWKHGKVANTLNTFDQGEARANELVVQSYPVICLQGNGIDRADTAGCNGKGWEEDTSYTLNTIDRPAVAFAMQGFGDYKESETASACKARDYKDATDLVAGVDCRNMNEYPELYPTLQAKPNGGQSLNFSGAARVRYIVRRLTPTECARLQGFADWWGVVEQKDGLTDEEYQFWLEVRNTHAAINGKKEQDYTEKQMLTWYNKLWTDSAEYKMWGNGIALPPALYCLQGIVDALNKPEEDDDSWLS